MKYNKSAFTPLERKSSLQPKADPPLAETGFTLIEIVIALLVLAVGLLGILALFPVGLDAVGRAANITKATFLAQKEIEEAKRLGYANVVDIGPPAVQAATPYQYFDYQLDESAVAGTTNLKRVDVQVSWPSGAPVAGQSITVTTFIADYEPW